MKIIYEAFDGVRFDDEDEMYACYKEEGGK